MRHDKTFLKMLGSLLLAALCATSFSVESDAVTIDPVWIGDIPAQQRSVIEAAISEIEVRFPGNTNFVITIGNSPLTDRIGPGPGEEWAITEVDGEFVTLAYATSFAVDANLCPASATIIYNSDTTTFKWSWTLELPAADRIDGLTVSRHELLHAIGFTVYYDLFDGYVDPATREFECDSVWAQLTPTTTHLDPDVHVGDLMIPYVSAGTRTGISSLDENMIRCAFSGCYVYYVVKVPLTSPSGRVGLILLLALAGIAALVMPAHRKFKLR